MHAHHQMPDWATTLHACARPLIALATQLRTAVPANPAATGRAVRDAVARFEGDLASGGCDARTVAAASYLMCVWLDEVITPHAWAAAAWPTHGLLAQFHQETEGGQRVFQLLDKLCEQPAQDRALLELFYVCLSLGLQGRWGDLPDGARQLDSLRRRLAKLLGLEAAQAASMPLSARWQAAVGKRKPGGGWRLRLGAVLLSALIAMGMYVASQWSLARQVDQVFAGLHGLERTSQAGARPMAVAQRAQADQTSSSATGRLATVLSTDLKRGDLTVRDEAHRSVISLPCERVFEPGTTQLTAAARPLLERIADALSRHGGRALVTAYADPGAARPSRIVTASQLADEWANQVQSLLRQRMGATPVATEGRAESVTPAGAASANRIEIVLFP
jgi:type VI secretion system protein ImpK